MKTLAIDFGTKKIGLAITDPKGKIVFPLRVIENKNKNQSDYTVGRLDIGRGKNTETTHRVVSTYTLSIVSKIIRRERIQKIVVGMPIYQKNKNKPEIYNQVLEFIAELKNHFPKIKIDTQDELLSSQSAQSLTKQKNRHDLAAMVILEDYLEKVDAKSS